MRTFVYEAIGPNGSAKSTLTARTYADAIQQLNRLGLLPVSIRERSQGLWARVGRGVKPQQVADMIRNLADLLSTGGVPLLQAIVSLRQEESSSGLAEVLAQLAAAIEQGRPLGEAMATRPDVFPDVVVCIVSASEARGELDRTLAEAARYLDRQVDTLSKIRGALAYPMFIAAVAVGVVIFMSVGVMPRFAEMFAASGISLPLSTRVLIAFGTTVARLWYLALPAAAATGAGATWIVRRPGTRRRLERWGWRLPGVRLFVRNFAYARWAMTVGLMNSSGVPLLLTLELARGVVGNDVLNTALAPVVDQVRDGEPLSRVLRRTGAFAEPVLQIVALGEEHGTLGEMLQRIGRRYEVQAERLLDKLPALIEPAFIVVVGSIIGVLLLALYYPIINIYQVAAKGGG